MTPPSRPVPTLARRGFSDTRRAEALLADAALEPLGQHHEPLLRAIARAADPDQALLGLVRVLEASDDEALVRALTGDADAVSQRDVDRALAELRTSDTRRSAKKGAAPQTEDAVSRAVRDSPDGLTASEVARALGSSRVTAWRYLERLADDHVLERDTEYGSAGRPQVRYRWRRR